uniref:Uncharacterized protein n=1 Tax=Cafeteria roenbergensis TaxID=33653 RepID=A0A7S0K517_CAFRO
MSLLWEAEPSLSGVTGDDGDDDGSLDGAGRDAVRVGVALGRSQGSLSRVDDYEQALREYEAELGAGGGLSRPSQQPGSGHQAWDADSDGEGGAVTLGAMLQQGTLASAVDEKDQHSHGEPAASRASPAEAGHWPGRHPHRGRGADIGSRGSSLSRGASASRGRSRGRPRPHPSDGARSRSGRGRGRDSGPGSASSSPSGRAAAPVGLPIHLPGTSGASSTARSGRASHRDRARSAARRKRELLFVVDVNVGGEVVGQLPVRRSTKPLSLATRFVAEQGLGSDLTVKLTKVIENRLRAFLDDESKRLAAAKRRGVRRQVEAFRHRATEPKPFTFASERLARERRSGGGAKPVVGRLRVRVRSMGRAQQGTLVLRLGDRAEDVVERFRRTYGLDPDEVQTLVAAVARRLEEAEAKDEERRREAARQASKAAGSRRGSVSGAGRTRGALEQGGDSAGGLDSARGRSAVARKPAVEWARFDDEQEAAVANGRPRRPRAGRSAGPGAASPAPGSSAGAANGSGAGAGRGQQRRHHGDRAVQGRGEHRPPAGRVGATDEEGAPSGRAPASAISKRLAADRARQGLPAELEDEEGVDADVDVDGAASAAGEGCEEEAEAEAEAEAEEAARAARAGPGGLTDSRGRRHYYTDLQPGLRGQQAPMPERLRRPFGLPDEEADKAGRKEAAVATMRGAPTGSPPSRTPRHSPGQAMDGTAGASSRRPPLSARSAATPRADVPSARSGSPAANMQRMSDARRSAGWAHDDEVQFDAASGSLLSPPKAQAVPSPQARRVLERKARERQSVGFAASRPSGALPSGRAHQPLRERSPSPGRDRSGSRSSGQYAASDSEWDSDDEDDDEDELPLSAGGRQLTERQQALLASTLAGARPPSTQERSAAPQPSDPTASEARAPPRDSEIGRPVILRIDLEYEEDQWAAIDVREGDNVQHLAQDFCRECGLEPDMVPEVVATIVERLQAHQAATASQ